MIPVASIVRGVLVLLQAIGIKPPAPKPGPDVTPLKPRLRAKPKPPTELP